MTLTQEDFNSTWRRRHQGMDVEAELTYYWEVYQKLWNTCSTGQNDGLVRDCIISLLLHIEDMAHLKFGEAIMKEYRIAADFVLGTIKKMNLTESQGSDVQIDVYMGIKNAPESGLRTYIRDAFCGNDFKKLCDAMLWITTHNQPLASIYPDKAICINLLNGETLAVYGELCELNHLAELWLAFNWTDKEGKSIVEHLEHCFEPEIDAILMGYFDFDIIATDIEKFKVRRVRKDGAACLVPPREHYYVEAFSVTLPPPLPKDYRSKRLLGMVVEWRDRCYLCDPYSWMDKEEADSFESQEFVMEVKLELGFSEHEDEVTFSTGEKFLKYKDTSVEGSFTWIGDLKRVSEDEADKLRALGRSSCPTESLSHWNDATKDAEEDDPVKKPNYGYRPKGKNPAAYFEKKIGEIRDMFYYVDADGRALDFYEGWLAQARRYYDKSELGFSRAIVRELVWEATKFYEFYQDEFDCRSRLVKVVRESWQLWLEILKKGPSWWLKDAFVNLVYLDNHVYDLFEPRAPFSIDKALREIEKQIKQQDNNE